MLKDKKILVIDDTSSIRSFLQVVLEDEGSQFYGAATANDGLALCKDIKPDLVILDLGLPDRDGLEVLPDLKALPAPQSPLVFILTVRKGNDIINMARAKGADGYLSKPFIVEDLLEMISEQL